MSPLGLEVNGHCYSSSSDLLCQCMLELICWHELCDLFGICMLYDMNVQMMHG